MFTTDPGSFSLIRQSTELAAQTYELDKKSDWAIASLASILEISGETSRGLDLIRDAGKKGISLGWRTNLAKARLLFDGRNGDAVLEVLETVLKDPDHSAMMVAPTLIAAITSEYHGDEQIRQLNLWRKKCGSLEMDMAIANAHALSLNYDDALREYSQIIAKHPKHAEALLSKGIITLSHKKDITAAIRLFEQAITHAKVENDKIAAETHLALALIPQKKNVDQAIHASIRAIADAGDREAVLMTILTSFRKNQGLKPTIIFLETLYNRVPGLHLAHAIKGELLSEQLGRHMDATRDFTNAITLDPSRSEYYNGRGLAFLGMSDLEAALNDFETAVTTNPGDASARYNIACVQARLGMKSDAISSLTKAFELDDRLLTHALTDKDLVNLHADPEFKALMSGDRKMSSVAH
jgi:tetratricopeptide (TPR) repeat protein